MTDNDMPVPEVGKTDADTPPPEVSGLCNAPGNAQISAENNVEKGSTAANAALITLDRFPDDRFLTKIELAEALYCSPRTLNRMVEKFEIPPGIILGGRCVWIVGKVKLWLASSASRREAEAEKEAVRRRIR